MQSRVVSQHTSIGTPVKKKGGKPSSMAARHRKAGGHQDARSIVIAGFVGLVLASIVAAIWLYVKPLQMTASSEPVTRLPPSVADLEMKKTHSYWKVGSNTYRHYITIANTGEIIDAGTITVKEMLDQGIEVPGYSLPSKATGVSTGSSELAARFQAIQDHLK